MSPAGRASQKPPGGTALAAHEAGAAQLGEDVLEELDWDSLCVREVLSGDGRAVTNSKLGGRA